MKASYIFAIVAVATLAIGVARAETDPSTKINGSASDTYCGWSGGLYQTHAYDHCSVLRDYCETGEQVPQEVTRENCRAIRDNIEAARRAYSTLRTSTSQTDEAATKQLDSIDEQLNKCLELCTTLDGQADKSQADCKTVSDCCTKIADCLKTAQTAHEKLMVCLSTHKSNAAGSTSTTPDSATRGNTWGVPSTKSPTPDASQN